MKKILTTAVVGVLIFSSCAPAYNPTTANDDLLTCDEIRAEIARAETARNEAMGNKGLSGQNIGWALLFIPGIFINEASNSQVIAKADERISSLKIRFRQKSCEQQEKPSQPHTAPAEGQPPVAAPTTPY